MVCFYWRSASHLSVFEFFWIISIATPLDLFESFIKSMFSLCACPMVLADGFDGWMQFRQGATQREA